MNLKKTTVASRKHVAVPKTVQEKYDKLKIKNSKIESLKKAFDLEVAL
ncbi:hypothetical protein KAU11_08910 [Candidatus Babeliales bacterium]|nr:hypothetical protein [Candidatus Babeliales bacterium]